MALKLKLLICLLPWAFADALPEKRVASNSTEREKRGVPSREERGQWRDEILSGIEKYPRSGQQGIFVVWGFNAEPIVTTVKPEVIYVAAAEFGTGRLVAFTRASYPLWFLGNNVPDEGEKLVDGVLRWVTKGRYTEDWKVVKMTEAAMATASPNDTVIIWKASDFVTPQLEDQVKEFVRKGGSLVYGITSWNWKNEGEVYQLPGYNFMKEAGIFLTDKVSYYLGADIVISNSRAEDAHLGETLTRLQAEEITFGETDGVLFGMDFMEERDLEDMLTTLNLQFDIESTILRYPTEEDPLTTEEELATVVFANMLLKITRMAAPGVEEFPGAFDSTPSLTTMEYNIEAHFSEAHPVGAYLPPGGTMTVEILAGDPEGWDVQVGCHTDDLSHKDKLERWPDISVEKKLKTDGATTIFSAFGGSVYMYSPRGTSSLSVRLTDVVPSPLFRIGDTVEEWKENRNKPGLWADFVGENIQISLPSKNIRAVENPEEVMEWWDAVVANHRDLRCLDDSEKWREWIVTDLQPVAGYMHSGYPIVTHMDVADQNAVTFLLRKLESTDDQNRWGLFHELGHNMQSDLWTFGGAGEVTVNIFSLHGGQTFFGIPPWSHPWLEDKKEAMKNYLKAGADFEAWKKKPGVALGVYAQLARDFGFDTYKQVFQYYEDEEPSLPTDQDEIDYWVKTFSVISGSNLVPVHKFWGWPISDSVVAEIQALGLEEYMPQDEVTQAVATP